MTAWVILNIWHILCLVVMLGPVGFVVSRWAREDQAKERFAVLNGLAAPKTDATKRAMRWMIGIALFLVGGYVSHVMYEVSDTIYYAVEHKAAF